MQKLLEIFRIRLPSWTRATDDLLLGTVLLPKLRAIERRYIQHNGPIKKTWFVFDLDRPGAAHDWQLRKAPAPNIAIENRANGHAHALYGLALPIHVSSTVTQKPLRYAAAIEHALMQKLDADPNYTNYLVKNPLSTHWNVICWEDRLYDLDWLADGLDLSAYQDRRRLLPPYGLGRNVTLFDHLRRWAYRAIRADWPSYEAWRAAVLEHAATFNDFPAPLPWPEVRSTAKSVAKWTWRKMSTEGFRAFQRRVGRLGGLASGVARRYQSSTKRQLLLSYPGMSCRTVEALTGIPRSTVARLRVALEGIKSTIPDMASWDTPTGG